MFIEVKKLYDKDANAVNLGDFGDVESKELVEKKLFNTIKDAPGKWAARSYLIPLMAPYKTASYRVRVQGKAKDSDSYVLVEGIKPDPTGKLTYLELTKKVKSYGAYAEYTDEDMYYGFDAIVDDLRMTVADNATEIVNDIAAKAWFSGNSKYTVSAGLTREDIIKIRISLGKFAGSNKQVHCIITPEDLADLRLKYNVAGANLFSDLPVNAESVINGTLTKFENVIFEEDDSDYMYGTAKRYAIFYVLDKKGNPPVGLVSPNGTNGEFITKALGSSGAKSDPLDQVGSIGVKWKGLNAMNTAEECEIRCEITPATTGITGNAIKIDSHYDFNNGKIYVFGTEVARSNLTASAYSPDSIVLYGDAKVKVGSTLTLKMMDETGTTIAVSSTGQTWTSSDTTVATVAAGVVTGVAVGTTVIKVVKGGQVATYRVTVIAA